MRRRNLHLAFSKNKAPKLCAANSFPIGSKKKIELPVSLKQKLKPERPVVFIKSVYLHIGAYASIALAVTWCVLAVNTRGCSKCLSMASTTVGVHVVVTFVLSEHVPGYSIQPCNSPKQVLKCHYSTSAQFLEAQGEVVPTPNPAHEDWALEN